MAAFAPLLRKPKASNPASAGLLSPRAGAFRRDDLRRAGNGPAASGPVPEIVHSVIGAGGGQPLAAETRAVLEPRFAFDFSHVRVHYDARAARSAEAVHARAYTVGHDVVFGRQQFAPGTRDGMRLLAHELTHVMQQDRAKSSEPPRFFGGDTHELAEAEADTVANRIVSGPEARGPVAQPVRHHVARQIARSPDRYNQAYGAGAEATVTREGAAIGQDSTHAPLQAASDFVGLNGKRGMRLDPAMPLTEADLQYIFIPATPALPKADTDAIQAVIPARVRQLNDAFRIMQIDTAEAQAVYLANAYSESWQLRQFSAGADPAMVGNFPGRGPLQVTLAPNYLKTLAYLDAEAERLEALAATKPEAAADAATAREASKAIKADPAAAADPRFAMLFSAAYMHAAGHGGVKLVANLSGGVDPTFGGNSSEDSWMLGQNIATQLASWTATQDRLTKLIPAMPTATKENIKAKTKAQKDLAHATERVGYWTGVQKAAGRKDAAYDRAMKRLKPKALPDNGYGYRFPEDPLNNGGFGPNDSTMRVRPGPVRSTLLRPR